MTNSRAPRGNMLVLTAAVGLIIVMVVLFALGYVRLIGTSSEQKTAIEAAAIAAAKDISEIVVESPDFGLVGLSDSAPFNTNPSADDNFCTPVHSINTLVGTARLDYLIASQPGLDIAIWRDLAKVDHEKAKAAAQTLIDKIKTAIVPGGSAKNKKGATIKPYLSAEEAYKSNQIRMSGGSSYVANSLQLSLGELEGGMTNVPTPQPDGCDLSLNSDNTAAGSYKSYVNIPVGSETFVFAGIGNTIKLVDWKRWTPQVPGLDYDFPTIVRAEAVQLVKNAGAPAERIRSVACAQPASVYDPRPAPGALTLSFPDGVPDGAEKLTCPLDLYGPLLSQPSDVSDYLQANPGDYPTDKTPSSSMGMAVWPLADSDPKVLASSCCKLAVYDWIRRAGTRADVGSIVGMHTTIFLPQGADVPWPPDTKVGMIPQGISHIYKFDTDGVIDYEAVPQKPRPYWVISDRQNLVECFDAITNGATSFMVQPVDLTIIPPIKTTGAKVEFTPRYDMYIRMYSRTYGNPGGHHEGEPMDNQFVSFGKLKLFKRSGLATVIHDFKGRGALHKEPPLIGIGVGAIPTIMPQEDFSFEWNLLTVGTGPEINRTDSEYERFQDSGSGLRPTYKTNGSVADIRFRRVVIARDPVSNVINFLGQILPIQKQQGYVSDK